MPRVPHSIASAVPSPIPLSPRQRYQADLLRADFTADPAQALAVEALERIQVELIGKKPRRTGLANRLEWPAVRGLYLWGGVGRGKTYLMDCFYDSLPFTRKRRTHFHRFMHAVHEARRQYPDAQDPMARVAADIAAQARVLCFDEFFVSDIADAMILARLLEVLFDHGVTLIATSNIAPEGLYKDGLQRQRFLPAIALIQQHTQVMHVDGGTDYRLRVLELAELYHHPLDNQADINLQQYFDAIAPEPGVANAKLRLHGRDLQTRHRADGVLWMDFSALCKGPRGTADYSEIARCFHTVLLSSIPRLDHELEDESRRFVNLVDEFYDRGVKLILSAAEPLETLYQGERLKFEFQRTESRLREMQSRQYLARPHLP
jgi:cell division protein ZapE